MSRFNEYFLMKTDDIAEYIEEKLHYFSDDSELSCKEIGDGNLNYVFRLVDNKTGKSIIVKHAGVNWRINDEVFLSTDRGRIEAEIMRIQDENAPGLVPKVYLYDPVMCCIVMEDMIGHKMMRSGLINHEIYPNFSEHVSEFMAKTLVATSDIVLDHKEKKELVKRFINPDLCEITEDLVYSEPYLDYNSRNVLFEPNAEFLKKEIYEDKQLHLEAAKLKFEFMNNAQALIHGDLHTGSIFINHEHTFFFDPEFAFFAPMAYDVGNIIANMFFAWCNGDATINNEAEKKEFCGWVLQTIEEIIDKFIVKFKREFSAKATDKMAKVDGFLDWYLSDVLMGTAGVVGLESIRRTVGIAKVRDITIISEVKSDEARIKAERRIVTFAKNCIKNREKFKCGADYINAINEAIALY